LLVITRTVDDKIMIGNDIVIKIVRIKGSQVRIGIECPKDMVVLRKELYEENR